MALWWPSCRPFCDESQPLPVLEREVVMLVAELGDIGAVLERWTHVGCADRSKNAAVEAAVRIQFCALSSAHINEAGGSESGGVESRERVRRAR